MLADTKDGVSSCLCLKMYTIDFKAVFLTVTYFLKLVIFELLGTATDCWWKKISYRTEPQKLNFMKVKNKSLIFCVAKKMSLL